MVVFAASEEPLPLTSVEDPVLFQARRVLAGSEPVLRVFSKPHVYKLGSVYGCACGFGYSPSELDVLAEADWPDEVKVSKFAEYGARQESVRRLKEYLRLAVEMGTAEVYSCWEGDEEEPDSRLDVTLDHFGGDAFAFEECQFLTVAERLGSAKRTDAISGSCT